MSDEPAVLEGSQRLARVPAASCSSTRSSGSRRIPRRKRDSPIRSSRSRHSLIRLETRRHSLTPTPPDTAATSSCTSTTADAFRRPRFSRTVSTSPGSHASRLKSEHITSSTSSSPAPLRRSGIVTRSRMSPTTPSWPLQAATAFRPVPSATTGLRWTSCGRR